MAQKILKKSSFATSDNRVHLLPVAVGSPTLKLSHLLSKLTNFPVSRPLAFSLSLSLHQP